MFIRRKTYDELREMAGRNEAQAEDMERFIDMIERMRAENVEHTCKTLRDVEAELGDARIALQDVQIAKAELQQRVQELTASRNTYRAVSDNCEKNHDTKPKKLNLFDPKDSEEFQQGVQRVAEDMQNEKSQTAKASQVKFLRSHFPNVEAGFGRTHDGKYRVTLDLKSGLEGFPDLVTATAKSGFVAMENAISEALQRQRQWGKTKSEHIHAYMGMPSTCICGEPNPDDYKKSDTEREDQKNAELRFAMFRSECTKSDVTADKSVSYVFLSRPYHRITCTIIDERLSGTEDHKVTAHADTYDHAMLFAIALYNDRPAKVLELARLKKEMGL